MRFPLFMAMRYLFARKSHNVINIISAISACGVAIGCAALIVVMSVFNGFTSLIENHSSALKPDLLVKDRNDALFRPDENISEKLKLETGAVSVNLKLEGQAFAFYDRNQNIVNVMGTDADYAEKAGQFITEGKFRLNDGDIDESVVGSALASDLRMRTRFLTPLKLYYPDKDRNISLINPASSMNSAKTYPSGIIRTGQESDANTVYIAREVAEKLFGTEKGTVSSIEIDFRKKPDRSTVERIRSMFPGLEVLDRKEQNAELYKMTGTEKIFIYIMLFFIITVISFNIFGSLSMLLMDKKDDIGTLMSMGAGKDTIRHIFILEGWLISFSGILAGTIIGTTVSLLQQHFGIIQMPGSFIVEAYPVQVKLTDIAVTVAGCSIIGLATAFLPARFIAGSSFFENAVYDGSASCH